MEHNRYLRVPTRNRRPRSVAGMLACVATFALEGVSTKEVTVEVDVRRGLGSFTLVGLPDRAVRESRERVRAAVLNSALEFPQKRITVNLAPAHVRKAGPSFDLAIALGLLAATEQVPIEATARYALCGELSLSGEIKPVRGTLAVALGARKAGFRNLLVPAENAAEAALVEGLQARGIPTLGRLADLLHGRWDPDPARPELPDPEAGAGTLAVDLADVRGQEDAKRAPADSRRRRPQHADDRAARRRQDHACAAHAGHPAAARASRRRSEVTQVHSAAGIGTGRLATERPFRAPHHTISAQGLVGGGQPAAAGRDHARASRRPVPRRAAGVRPQRGGRSAPAARGGPGRDHARAAHARVSGERDRARGLQPLPVRAPAGRLRAAPRWSAGATSAA